MSDERFQIIFKGEIAQGFELDTVKANIAALFKTTPDKIEKLFSGNRVVIKSDLDKLTAQKYLSAMQQRGALCELKMVGAPAQTVAAAEPPAPKEPEPPVAPVQENPVAASAEPVNHAVEEENIVITAPPPPPEAEVIEIKPPVDDNLSETGGKTEVSDVDINQVDIAPPGETIMEHEKVADAQIDVSSLSMSEPGIRIMDHEPVPEPDINIDSLTMAPLGSTIDENKK